jgi:hypothetical protein
MSTKTRSKMISFRVSTREYEQFRDFCVAQGTHSVSELARTAVNKLVTDPTFAVDNVLEARVNELEGQLHMLSLEMKRIKQVAAPELLGPMVQGK